jgi:quinohemoprotein ethanol dehydrogenase
VIGGTATLPQTPPPHLAIPLAAPQSALDTARVRRGAEIYMRCLLCHGPGAVAGGTAPDLRASTVPLSEAGFAAIVRGGALVTQGMPNFPELTDEQLTDLRQYLRAKARSAASAETTPAAP